MTEGGTLQLHWQIAAGRVPVGGNMPVEGRQQPARPQFVLQKLSSGIQRNRRHPAADIGTDRCGIDQVRGCHHRADTNVVRQVNIG